MSSVRLADFYRQLATYIEAGMPILRSLETLSQQGRHRIGKLCVGLLASIQQGSTLGEAVDSRSDVFPAFHRALIKLGEKSGSLPLMLKNLADFLESSQRLRSQMLLGLIYPALAYHVIAIIISSFRLLMGNQMKIGFYPLQGAVTLLVFLLPVYGTGAFIWILRRAAKHQHHLALVLSSLGLAIPVLGRITRNTAMSRFFRAMHSLYLAGVHMPEAVEMAAEASGNAMLEGKIRPSSGVLSRGEAVTLALASTAVFDHEELAMLQTGAESGRLDEMLLRLAEQKELKAQQAMKIIAAILPVLAILLLACIAMVFIVSIFSGYVSNLNELLN